MGFRIFAPQVAACPGCGRTTSTVFQELARDIQRHLSTSMPVWRARYPGVERLNVAVMGCIVNGPGESKHADIGISLPGTGETPAAPVFVDGVKTVTLRGPRIADDFKALVEDYIARRFGGVEPGGGVAPLVRPASPSRGRTRRAACADPGASAWASRQPGAARAARECRSRSTSITAPRSSARCGRIWRAPIRNGATLRPARRRSSCSRARSITLRPPGMRAKHETGKVVPTWNYVMVQARGPVASDRRRRLAAHVRSGN